MERPEYMLAVVGMTLSGRRGVLGAYQLELAARKNWPARIAGGVVNARGLAHALSRITEPARHTSPPGTWRSTY